MVWEMISSVGVGPIVRFHGNIKASLDKELFRQHALPHLRFIGSKFRVGSRI